MRSCATTGDPAGSESGAGPEPVAGPSCPGRRLPSSLVLADCRHSGKRPGSLAYSLKLPVTSRPGRKNTDRTLASIYGPGVDRSTTESSGAGPVTAVARSDAQASGCGSRWRRTSPDKALKSRLWTWLWLRESCNRVPPHGSNPAHTLWPSVKRQHMTAAGGQPPRHCQLEAAASLPYTAARPVQSWLSESFVAAKV